MEKLIRSATESVALIGEKLGVSEYSEYLSAVIEELQIQLEVAKSEE